MDNKCLVLLVIIFLSGIASINAWAFDCKTQGVPTHSGGTVAAQVAPPVLKKDTHSNVPVINMATSVTCSGNNLDNLRIYTSSIDSRLASYGFSGVLNIAGTRYDMPASGQYIWPWPNSSAALTPAAGYIPFPVNLTLELKRNATGAWGAGVTLPQGTVLATIVAQQRSGPVWGWNHTWNFVLNAPLVIPAYTCNVTNPANRIIRLPHADKSEVSATESGIVTRSKTRFSFNLDCDVMATVDLAFSGTTMTGKENVLANQASGNPNIGVQIFPVGSSTAITFDNVERRMFESASARQSLDYDAYYYYKGGALQGGPIRAVATYTFTYK